MAERFYKKLGETSYQCVERFRREFPQYEKERLAFAGRLDPMAEGEMLILIGDDNNNREGFMSKDKEYVSEFVFGVETDSFDVMGLVKEKDPKEINQKDAELFLQKTVGKFEQKFPPFSKRHVQGKAMFWWASQGRIDEIEIPTHEVEVYSIEILDWSSITGDQLVEYAHELIPQIEGDFRQEKILSRWRDWQKDHGKSVLQRVKVNIKCGTGTYIRQIAQDLGQHLGTGAIASTIIRKSVV